MSKFSKRFLGKNPFKQTSKKEGSAEKSKKETEQLVRFAASYGQLENY